MSSLMEDGTKPISPKKAAAELEAVLSKSMFLTTPESSDFDGSFSHSESDISRDSALEWTHPERRRRRLVPRSASNPRPQRQSIPVASGTVRSRPAAMGRSKSLGSATPYERQEDMYQLSKMARSLMDDDSCTVTSSVENSGEGCTFIDNIGDMKNHRSLDNTRSDTSRRSRRSARSRQSRASRRSMHLRKRGDSLEREISLAILHTAAEGADSAHFLVNNSEEVTSPVKSAEEILGDLFVSQDVSLEPISLEEGAIEFRAFFAEEEQQSPATTDDAVIATKPTEDTLFTFNPEGQGRLVEGKDEDDEAPSYAKKYINPLPETNRDVTAIISEAPSEDSLFSFSDVTEDTARGRELLFHEDALQEEFPIGSRWAPEDTLKKSEQPAPAKSRILVLRPRPEFNALSDKRPSTPQEPPASQAQLRTSSMDQCFDRYEIEMEYSAAGAASVGLDPSRSFVSASDGTSEVQQALAMVSSPASSTVGEGVLNLEREDSFLDEDNMEKVKQEEIFLDKLVDIVHVARERPMDIKLSEYYKSESTETESTATVEYPDDEQPTHADAENEQRASVPDVKSEEKIGDNDHPDPELDDFLEEHGFGGSDEESNAEEYEELNGEDDGEWMAFDNSPFGVSRFADDRTDEASGSTAPPPAEGKKSPESPTSITDFSVIPSAREEAKVAWWSKGTSDDTDVLSI